MKVRIRVRWGSAEGSAVRRRELASMVSTALLTPAAIMAFVLGAWRLGSDLNWTGSFAISSGLFSHWQVWIAAAGLLQTAASVLNRWGRRPRHDEEAVSSVE